MAGAAFRVTSAYDFVAGAVLLKRGFEMRTYSGDRACRVRGTQVKLRFLFRSATPFAEIVRVECAECR